MEYGAALVVSSLVALLILRSEDLVRALGRVVDAVEGLPPEPRSGHAAPPPPTPLPSTRPIELIARDVRRLRTRYRTLPQRGVAYAKVEGIRRAYDGVLLEACTALGITTLIGVLPDGTELELERDRAELLLGGAGLTLDAA